MNTPTEVVEQNQTTVTPNVYRSEKEVLFERREFLNMPGHGSFASICAQVKGTIEYTNDTATDYYMSPSLSLMDCANKVTYELSFGKSSYENSLYKLDTIVRILTEFKEAFIKSKEITELKKKEADENRTRLRKEDETKEVARKRLSEIMHS